MSMSTPRLLATMAAAHLPRLPCFLLFVFLAVHVPAAHGDPLPTTYDGSMCPESFLCGDVEIRYPFYLANATEATADHSGSYSCGYTDLNISCQAEGPVIHLSGESYTIERISYDGGTIILADTDVLAGSCPAVRHGVSFDEVWLHTSSSDNLTFYFGCPLDTVPPGLANYQINCNGFKSPEGDGPSFVFTSDDRDKAQELEFIAHCSEVVSVPVRSEGLTAHEKPMLAKGGYAEVLKYGFELEWNRTTTDQCYLCEQSKGKCAYSQRREFRGCLCSSRKVGHPDCSSTVIGAPRPRKEPFFNTDVAVIGI